MSSDGSYQDAAGSSVPLRARSPKRILSPQLGPSSPTTPVRGPSRPARQPQRVTSNRTSSTSSLYVSSGRMGPSTRAGIRTFEDPIMTITSAASANGHHVKHGSNVGHERIKKLEKGLMDCLSGPRLRRVVSDTVAARATRAGRTIDEPGREASEEILRARQVEKATLERIKEVSEIATTDLEGSGSVNTLRLSAPDAREKNRVLDQVMVNGPRRAISLRAESRSQWSVGDGIGIRSLSWLGRRKLVEWGMGVNPRIVYAADSTSGNEDGLGGGLTGTVLCRMGPEHRVWDVVRRGQKFVIRVVGSYMSDADDVVVYSVVGDGNSKVHSRRTGSGFIGVADRCGRVCDERAGDVITLCVGVNSGGRELLAGEMRWRLGGDQDVARSAAVLLRFGYYFFLREATGVRLYTTTHTPEHVRLVARRAADGAIDEHYSASLTYVVVRVAAD